MLNFDIGSNLDIGSPTAAAAASGPEDIRETIASMEATLEELKKENKVLKERLDGMQGKGGGGQTAPAEGGAGGGGQAVPAGEGRIDPLTGASDPWRSQGPVPGPPGMSSPTVETTPAALPPKAPDRKDVEGPAKYGGNPDEWLAWSKTFKKFLRRREPRWFALLERIEEQRGKPVTATLEGQWEIELELGPIFPWKDGLNEYLETYTKGDAKHLVEACGDARALDAWRQLADKGCSFRLAHANVLLKKARFPRTNVAAKELENAIARWEADIQVYERATGEAFPATHRRMSLEDMCPERLRAHLRANGPERYPSYDDLRIAISDWLADEAMHASKGGKALGAIGGAAEETTEDDWEYEEIHVYVPESESWVLGLAPKRQRTEEPDQPDAEMKAPPGPPGGKAAGKGKGKKGKGKGKAAPAAGCWLC